MFQWIFVTYVFYAAFLNGAFQSDKLRLFIPYLIFGHILSTILLIMDVGQQEWEANPWFYEHNLLSLFTIYILCELSVNRRYPKAIWVLLFYILALTALTDRVSVQGLNLILLFVCFFRVHPAVITVFAIFVIIFPVATALNISDNDLAQMADVDFNVYIRMDFVRGAYTSFLDSPFLGIGFDNLYRPANFPYLATHPLLNDLESLALVSNHHSVFDTFLRFGLILAPLFLWPIFRQMYVPSYDRNVQIGIMVLAFGLSFNAYFEQQVQISSVCFMTAFLLLKNASLRRAATAQGRYPRIGT
jgi:hypothetical protein